MPRINFNAPAMVNVNRQDQLGRTMSRSMQRVSSGERLTRAADDVAAFGVSERLRGQIRCLSVASRNVQDGVALINVAEGALNEIHDMLHRMRELSIQSANDTYTEKDRENMMMEVNKLKEEIDFISNTTHYNGQKLINGTGDWGTGEGGYFQISTNSDYNTDFVTHRIPAVNTETLGIRGDNMRIDTRDGAEDAIDKIKDAVEYVNSVRANLGGIANRLEESWKHIEKMGEDNQSYESILRDTDIAEEMIKLTRDQIISQYCNAMLAQANQTPQSILQLLRR